MSDLPRTSLILLLRPLKILPLNSGRKLIKTKKSVNSEIITKQHHIQGIRLLPHNRHKETFAHLSGWIGIFSKHAWACSGVNCYRSWTGICPAVVAPASPPPWSAFKSQPPFHFVTLKLQRRIKLESFCRSSQSLSATDRKICGGFIHYFWHHKMNFQEAAQALWTDLLL